jgi:hypothetical protein
MIQTKGERSSMPTTIEEMIDKKIGEVRTDALDLSFGEIVNLYSSSELIIQPEYQRLFRWTLEQRSRIVESILLELPIPQIFVIENSTGVIELIDGLQRVSSVIQFIEPTALELEPLRLVGCDLIPDLDGKLFEDLSLTLKLRIKRSSVRTVVIKRQSSSFLRYEMFKRLNTGGSSLMPQEIRNCTARMLGDEGVHFYEFLQECASNQSFRNCTETLSSADREQKADEELVLRFFATKNAQEMFHGSVRDWLDDYMEAVLLQRVGFNYAKESSEFASVFEVLDRKIGAGAFVRYRGQTPVGGLAPAYFEAVAIGTYRNLPLVGGADAERFRTAVADTVQSDEFRWATGPGANSREKLEKRIATIEAAIRAII